MELELITMWRVLGTNRRLTERHRGDPITSELLRKLGPRVAVEAQGSTVRRVVNFDRPIPYRLADED